MNEFDCILFRVPVRGGSALWSDKHT